MKSGDVRIIGPDEAEEYLGPQGVSLREKGLRLPAEGVVYAACGGVLGMTHKGPWPGIWTIHHAVKREWFGHAVEPGKKLLRWGWDNLEPELFVGFTPAVNRAAIAFAHRCGFRTCARLEIPSGDVIMTEWRDGY